MHLPEIIPCLDMSRIYRLHVVLNREFPVLFDTGQDNIRPVVSRLYGLMEELFRLVGSLIDIPVRQILFCKFRVVRWVSTLLREAKVLSVEVGFVPGACIAIVVTILYPGAFRCEFQHLLVVLDSPPPSLFRGLVRGMTIVFHRKGYIGLPVTRLGDFGENGNPVPIEVLVSENTVFLRSLSLTPFTLDQAIDRDFQISPTDRILGHILEQIIIHVIETGMKHIFVNIGESALGIPWSWTLCSGCG